MSRKIILMLYFINSPNFFVWLPLLLEISGNMCLAIVCYPVCNVRFFLKYSRRKRTFKVKWKAFFIIFEGLSVARNCLRHEIMPLMKGPLTLGIFLAKR